MRRAVLVLVVSGAMAVFAGIVVALLDVLPVPHSRTDYLVIGSLATLAALGMLFIGWIAWRAGRGELFWRRRRK